MCTQQFIWVYKPIPPIPLASEGGVGNLLGPCQGWSVKDAVEGGRGHSKAQLGLVTWFRARIYKQEQKSRLEY